MAGSEVAWFGSNGGVEEFGCSLRLLRSPSVSRCIVFCAYTGQRRESVPARWLRCCFVLGRPVPLGRGVRQFRHLVDFTFKRESSLCGILV